MKVTEQSQLEREGFQCPSGSESESDSDYDLKEIPSPEKSVIQAIPGQSMFPAKEPREVIFVADDATPSSSRTPKKSRTPLMIDLTDDDEEPMPANRANFLEEQCRGIGSSVPIPIVLEASADHGKELVVESSEEEGPESLPIERSSQPKRMLEQVKPAERPSTAVLRPSQSSQSELGQLLAEVLNDSPRATTPVSNKIIQHSAALLDIQDSGEEYIDLSDLDEDEDLELSENEEEREPSVHDDLDQVYDHDSDLDEVDSLAAADDLDLVLDVDEDINEHFGPHDLIMDQSDEESSEEEPSDEENVEYDGGLTPDSLPTSPVRKSISPAKTTVQTHAPVSHSHPENTAGMPAIRRAPSPSDAALAKSSPVIPMSSAFSNFTERRIDPLPTYTTPTFDNWMYTSEPSVNGPHRRSLNPRHLFVDEYMHANPFSYSPFTAPGPISNYGITAYSDGMNVSRQPVGMAPQPTTLAQPTAMPAPLSPSIESSHEKSSKVPISKIVNEPAEPAKPYSRSLKRKADVFESEYDSEEDNASTISSTTSEASEEADVNINDAPKEVTKETPSVDFFCDKVTESSVECRLCLTLHDGVEMYNMHALGARHQAMVARKAAKEQKAETELQDAQSRDSLPQASVSLSETQKPNTAAMSPKLSTTTTATIIAPPTTERGEPARKKARTNAPAKSMRTFVSGCVAGGLAVFGAALALLATIPAELHDEALRDF